MLGAFCVEVVLEQVFGRPGRGAGSQTRPERAHRIDGDAAPQAKRLETEERVTMLEKLLQFFVSRSRFRWYSPPRSIEFQATVKVVAVVLHQNYIFFY